MKNKIVDVLIVIRWPVGGIISFLSDLLKNLDSQNYRFTILAPKSAEVEVLFQRLNVLDVVFVPIEPRPTFIAFWWRTISFIFKNNFHLVHSQGLTAGVSSLFGCIITRTPHLLSLHDMFLDSHFEGKLGRIKVILLSVLLSMIDSIHLVSNDAYDNLLTYLPFLRKFKSKLIVSRNGVCVERFLDSPCRDLRKELGISHDKFIVGYLGRFMSPKGFVYLIDAIKILSLRKDVPRKPMVLAFGQDGFLREEMAYIKKHGIEDYFCFLPFAPDVAPVLKGLDVLAVPSVWEACGILPMEGMVSGVPVIGTDCIGLREVLSDTPNKIIPACDSEALANALLDEMRCPSKEKAVKFKEQAAHRFDAKNQAHKLDCIISSLIK